MHILVLGGTVFLGRHVVEQALARGHQVTMFNRGETNPALYPEVKKLRGNRNGDFTALAGKHFDSVIDTSGYLPRIVEATAKVCKGIAPHYLFVSSISAYAETDAEALDEDSPLIAWDPTLEDLKEVSNEHYGCLKAECERRVQTVFGDGAMIVRPGLIMGRYDRTGRFTYWPQRFQKGGRILIPDYKEFPVQVIDAADLAAWMVTLCEQQQGGALNGIGPKNPTTFKDILNDCQRIAPAGTERTYVSEDFLAKHKVAPWMGLPLWIPRAAKAEAMMRADLSRPVASGLRLRPMAETIDDVLAEIAETGTFLANQSLTAEREAELLALWDKEQAA